MLGNPAQADTLHKQIAATIDAAHAVLGAMIDARDQYAIDGTSEAAKDALREYVRRGQHAAQQMVTLLDMAAKRLDSPTPHQDTP